MRQFFDTFQKNSLLGIECLFRFPSKEIKDSVLNNYEYLDGGEAMNYDNANQLRKQSEEDYVEDEFNKKLEKEKVNPYDEQKDELLKTKQIWTEE